MDVIALLLVIIGVGYAEDTRDQCLSTLPPSCTPLPTSTLHPVCGTDNTTYSSLCHLQLKSCTTPNLKLRHRGRCSILTKCQTRRKRARAQNASFLPKCTQSGEYREVQCYRGTGFCWCVDLEGNPSKSVVARRGGRARCEKKGKSSLRRRSPTRRTRRLCSRADKALFNTNLIKNFQTEWLRLHDDSSHSNSDLDRLVLEWKFKDMDKNRDGKLDKTEYRDLRKLVKKFVKPKRCAKSFAHACDFDRDQEINGQEWTDCLSRDGIDEEDSRAEGDSLGDSSERDDEEEEEEDYMDFPPSVRRSPPPIEILRNPGALDTSHPSGEDASERLDEEAVDCLTDRQSVLNEQRPDTLYVPECTPDGRYKKIQCYKSVGYCWCVHEDTGKNIPGTAVQKAMPKCDQIPVSTRPMKGCPEPKKTVFLKDLMEFLHNRMVMGTNDTNITGSTSNWQASLEEKSATWNFVVLDKNKNKVLERKEWKVFRTLVSNQKQLKRCGKKLPRYCDVNSDQKISLTEWLECLNTKRNIPATQNQKQTAQRQGKNPLTSFLKDD